MDKHKQGYLLMANNPQIPILHNGVYTAFNPVFAYDENKEPDLNADPIGFLFSDKNTHTLYNDSFHILATIKQNVPKEFGDRNGFYEDDQIYMLAKKCSAFLQTSVRFQNNPIPGLVVPEEYRPQPEPGVFDIYQMDGGNMVFMRESEGVYRRFLFTKNDVTSNTMVPEKSNELTIKIPGQNDSISFYVNMKQRKIIVPEKYVQQFGLTIINK